MQRCLQNHLVLVSVVIMIVVFSAPVRAAEPNLDSIANRLVNTSLAVQPGESVLITGTPAEIPLMEALVVAVSKAGGQPIVSLNLPKANKRALMETPMEYLKLPPTANLLLGRSVDCTINAGSVQDPTLLADVPEERLAAARQGGATLNQAINVIRNRSINLGQVGGIPTEAYAKSIGADYAQLTDMFWRAIDVDANQLAQSGQRITAMLTPGTNIKVTSAAGTNLTFKVDRLPARINAGRMSDVMSSPGAANAWLPAGEAYACVNGSSANGTLVVPHTTYNGLDVTNLKLTFQNGKMTGTSADKNGEAIQKFLTSSSSNTKDLSVVDFGVNPQNHPMGNYLSYEMAGVVTLGIGNNSWAGGTNTADGALLFNLANTSVWVSDKAVTQDGKLQ